MAYIPPQKRNQMTNKSNNKSNHKSNHKSNTTIMTKSDFPQLAQPKPIKESKLDFKKLFKNVEIKRKKRENRIKRGWIKLTKEGLIDSLTPEERKQDDEYNEHYTIQYNMDKLVECWENHTQMRLERDGYLSDYSVDSPSEEEEEESEEEEEFEEELEEEEICDYDSKWFTS